MNTSRSTTRSSTRRQRALSGGARRAAIKILRTMVDAIDERLDSHPRGRAAHPLFELGLEVYAMWADLAHPGVPRGI